LHLYYIFIGAAAHLFVMAPECRRLTGVDPTEPEIVKAHADAIIDLLFKLPTEASASPKRRPTTKGKTR